MKSELTLIKIKCDESMIGQDIFIPGSEESIEVTKSLPYAIVMGGQVIYRGKHNLERHNLYHACIKLVSENTGRTKVQITEQCKIDCRHIDGYVYYKDKNDKDRVNVITKSTKFSKMTTQEAKEYYAKAFEVLAGYLNITTDELVNEAKLRMQTKHYCALCGSHATQKHHKFSQTKWAIEKYGRRLIDDPRNIEYICYNCHSSHAKIPPELNWNEKRFREEMGIDNILDKFDGEVVNDSK
jgi:hypothetical protein